MVRKPPEKRYFALNDLDRKLCDYIDYDGGFYVELGANDGRRQSNTLHFELFKGWRGVLIEAVPHNYMRCRALRGNKNDVHCAACVSFSYKGDFLPLAYCDLMSTPLEIESDIADPLAHAMAGRQYMEPSADVIVFGARARTLNVILQESNAPERIDLLSLDVEGGEIEVLKGIDHSVYRFSYILVESRDLDRMRTYLGEQGYDLVTALSFHDYLFKMRG